MTETEQTMPIAMKTPGVCIPWTEKLEELPEITGEADLVQRQWETVDELSYTFIWHVLVSF